MIKSSGQNLVFLCSTPRAGSSATRDWEIIIVNDGSSDATSEEARRLVARFPGWITLVEKPNGGTSSARNVGIRTARAGYVFVLDADDRISRKMLAATKAILDADPQVGSAYTDFRCFGETDGVVQLPPFDPETLIRGPNGVRSLDSGSGGPTGIP